MDLSQPIDAVIHSERTYLTKHDIPAAGLNVTIKGWDMAEVDKNEPQKAILKFEGDAKPLVMNVTNRNRLMARYPDAGSLADFIGKSIRIYFDPNVEFGGKVTGGIRIDASIPAPAADNAGEDIPF